VAPSLRASRRSVLAWLTASASGALLAACASPPPTPTAAPKPAEPPKPVEAPKPAAATPATTAPAAATKPAEPAAAQSAPTKPAAEPKPAAVPTTDARRVELSMSGWAFDGDIIKAYQEFGTQFAQREPRVTAVKFQNTPFVRYHDVLNVQLAGGRAPDVAHIFTSISPAYIDAGTLIDLQPVLTKLKDYQFEDFVPGLLRPWVRGERIHGLPFTIVPNVVYYNADLFEKAGLPTPDKMLENKTWTWEELKSASKKLKDSGAARFGFHFGAGLFANGWRSLEDIWTPYGAQPWTADGKTCTMDSPECVEATTVIHSMMFGDKSHPGPGTEADWFVGDVGMTLARPSQAVRAKDVKYKWGIAPQPSGPKGYGPALGTNGISVLKTSKNPGLAADFLAFTTSVESSKRMAANFPPARKSLQTTATMAAVNPLLKPDQIEKSIIAALSAPNASFGYRHLNWGPVFANAQTVIDAQLWKADANIKTVLTNACAAIKDLLG
jgi:multiple sugar transport system substrate-binding protein